MWSLVIRHARWLALLAGGAVLILGQPAGLRVAAAPAARFGSIVFSYLISTESKPVLPSTRFPAGISKVFAAFEVQGVERLKAGDVVSALWYRGRQTLPRSETKITITDQSGPHFWFAYQFSLPGPSSSALPGSYRLEVSLNGKVVQRGAFEVLPPSSVKFGPIVFARGIDPDLKVVDPSTKFPAGTTAVHAIYEITGIEGLKAADVLGQVWYRGRDKLTEGKEPASQFGVPVKGPFSSILSHSLSNGSGMPGGSYHVDLSLNGKVLQTGAFEVLPK